MVKMKEMKPFDFSRLKKLNRRSLDLQEALLAHFPLVDNATEIMSFFREVMQAEFGKTASALWQGSEEQTYSQFLKNIDAKAVFVMLSHEPSGEKWLLKIDYLLAMTIVDDILGGGSEDQLMERPLGVVEQGILQYVVLSFLSKLRGLQDQSQFSLRFIGIYGDEQVIMGQRRDNELGCVLKYLIKLENQDGLVQIYLPHPLIEGVLLKDQPLYQTGQEARYEQIEKLGFVRTVLSVELGHAELAPQDLFALEKGDVIVFDESMVHLNAGQSSGRVILRVGQNQESGLLAELISSDEKTMVKLIDFYGGEL